jgi:hypothetical protein
MPLCPCMSLTKVDTWRAPLGHRPCALWVCVQVTLRLAVCQSFCCSLSPPTCGIAGFQARVLCSGLHSLLWQKQLENSCTGSHMWTVFWVIKSLAWPRWKSPRQAVPVLILNVLPWSMEWKPCSKRGIWTGLLAISTNNLLQGIMLWSWSLVWWQK